MSIILFALDTEQLERSRNWTYLENLLKRWRDNGDLAEWVEESQNVNKNPLLILDVSKKGMSYAEDLECLLNQHPGFRLVYRNHLDFEQQIDKNGIMTPFILKWSPVTFQLTGKELTCLQYIKIKMIDKIITMSNVKYVNSYIKNLYHKNDSFLRFKF